MYIIDDICYASNQDAEPRIIAASPLKGRMLLVTFSTGEQRLFDCTQLTEPAFEPLEDEEVFLTAQTTCGFISWDGGRIDIAPEFVYENSLPYDCEDNALLVG